MTTRTRYTREVAPKRQGYQVYFVLWGDSAHPTKNADAILPTLTEAHDYAAERLPTMARFVTAAEIYQVPGLHLVDTILH